MKLTRIVTTIGASFALYAPFACGKHNHAHLNQLDLKHRHHIREAQTSKVEDGGALDLREVSRRGGSCQFPTSAGLVAVTPGSQNAGWAMSPNQPCTPGMYCPYACPPGQVMNQWDPKATSYTYPASMNGGLYCDQSGAISKPFPDQPYCVTQSTNIGAINKVGEVVSFCQTVLPGNEAMLIPTSIEDEIVQLAIPDTNYWCGTAAHFYINPPGIDCNRACVWGTNENPYGNWSPYVAGGNTDEHGNTFIKLAWNPIYLEPATPFCNTMPTWGVEIVCDGPGCNGLPCAIDPTVNQVNEMVGSNTGGAGGANFCVVTVPSGVMANFVVFDGSAGGAGKSSSAKSSPSSIATQAPTPMPTPTPTPTPSSSTKPSSTSSTKPSSTSSTKPSSTSSTKPSSTSSTYSSTPSTASITTLSFSSTSNSQWSPLSSISTTTDVTTSSTSSTSLSSFYPSYSYLPHVLLQNATITNVSTYALTTMPSSLTGSAFIPSISPIGSATSPNGSSRTQVTAASLILSVLIMLMVIAI